MNKEDRSYIHGIARLEKTIRSVQMDEFVCVTAAHGEFAGEVESVNKADPGEGNYVVVVDANVFNSDAMDADIHTVTIDYEGAFSSEFDHYCPYITGTADDRTLGDVSEMYHGEIVGGKQ